MDMTKHKAFWVSRGCGCQMSPRRNRNTLGVARVRAFDDDMTRRKHSGWCGCSMWTPTKQKAFRVSRGLRAFDVDTTKEKHSGCREGAGVGCRHDKAETLWLSASVRVLGVHTTKQNVFWVSRGCGCSGANTTRQKAFWESARVRVTDVATTKQKAFWVSRVCGRSTSTQRSRNILAVAEGASVGCRHDKAETLWLSRACGCSTWTRRNKKRSGCRECLGGGVLDVDGRNKKTLWLSRGLRALDVATTRQKHSGSRERAGRHDQAENSGCRQRCGCRMSTRRGRNILGCREGAGIR